MAAECAVDAAAAAAAAAADAAAAAASEEVTGLYNVCGTCRAAVERSDKITTSQTVSTNHEQTVRRVVSARIRMDIVGDLTRRP